MIQTYDVVQVFKSDGTEIKGANNFIKRENGKGAVVKTEDHLAALAEKDALLKKEREHSAWLEEQLFAGGVPIPMKNDRSQERIDNQSSGSDIVALNTLLAEKDKIIAGLQDSVGEYGLEERDLHKKIAEQAKEIERLEQDLTLNAQLLARQTDLAREAETEVAKLMTIILNALHVNDWPTEDLSPPFRHMPEKMIREKMVEILRSYATRP